jgi:hypothetical protein
MAGETRAHHRRSSREAAKRAQAHDEMIVCAWVEAEEWLDEGRQVTHDALIEMLGPRRRSGVRWTMHEGSEALEACSVLLQSATGGSADYYRQLRGKVREFGGWIVIAYAQAVD